MDAKTTIHATISCITHFIWFWDFNIIFIDIIKYIFVSGYLEKGVHQAKKTRQIFDEILEKGYCKDKSIKTRLYRNFFMQQVMINAEKMLMYGVGDGNQGWNLIVDSMLRKDLLSENYEIVDTLIPEMGRAVSVDGDERFFLEAAYYRKYLSRKF